MIEAKRLEELLREGGRFLIAGDTITRLGPASPTPHDPTPAGAQACCEKHR